MKLPLETFLYNFMKDVSTCLGQKTEDPANRHDSRKCAQSHVIGNLVVLIIGAALLSFVSAKLILYSLNTLEAHPNWVSGKLWASAMGAQKAVQTRNLLQGNRLHLDAWHGFNEIYFNRIFQFSAIRFQFRLGNDAYLNVIFNKTAAGLSGVRFSRHAQFPSIYYRADRSGGYLVKQALSEALITDSRWHEGEIRVAGGKIEALLDHRVVAVFNEEPLARQIIGFRSGAAPALVDDVFVTDEIGTSVVKETFTNRSRMPRLFFTCLMAAFLFAAGCYWLISVIDPVDNRALIKTMLVQFWVLVLILTYFGFDFYYWSGRYPYSGFTPWRGASYSETRFERWRAKLARAFDFPNSSDASWRQEDSIRHFLGVGEPLIHSSLMQAVIGNKQELFVKDEDLSSGRFQEDLPKHPFIIAFVGTSQTWGEGALRDHDRFVYQAHRLLATRRPQLATRLVTLNLSRRGETSSELLKWYQDTIAFVRPAVTVFNLSNNDGDMGAFERNLARFVEFDRRSGVQTIFCLEANGPEVSRSWIQPRHRVMATVARQFGVPCLNLDAHFSTPEVYDSGFIWWDEVHFTSYGHGKAAEFFADALLPFIDEAEHCSDVASTNCPRSAMNSHRPLN